MPTINVNDAYVLNETGAEVDKVTGLFTKNENASTGEKQMARLNIAAGGSNRNLLDNAYFVGGGSQLGDGHFPINQRGQTSYSGGDSIDRWSTDDTLTLYADGIASPNGAIYESLNAQYFATLLGKTLTASVLFNDGTIISGTATMPSSMPTSMQTIMYNWDVGLCTILDPNWNQAFRINGAAIGSKRIAAVKLEEGTVSTLANDVAPDFSDELRKCKRYLQFVSLKRSPFVFESAYSIAIKTLEGVEMAKFPTAWVVTAGTAIQLDNSATANILNAATITFESNTPTIQMGLSSALSGAGYIIDTIIGLSCTV